MPPTQSARRVLVDVGAQTFTVEWSDGHVSVFPLDGLRRACPCATCRGHDQMHLPPDPMVFRLPALQHWTDVRVAPAGHIGLRITWDDGHDTGIYSWALLRAMCPCPACSSAGSTA